MKKIYVRIKNNRSQDYPIFIGNGLLMKISSLIDLIKYSKALIVTDKNIPSILIQDLQTSLPIESSIVMLDASEQHKDIESIKKIWEKLQSFGCDRKSLVVNLGGGVIGDIGGFAAATFMRGIDFLQIPTTLLSQVDASVGGKVGINFLGIKNLIGTFQQPIAVIIDIKTLSSLPPREFISGFAEIIKHGLIADKDHFQFAISKKPRDFSENELLDIIEKSCKIKAAMVSKDEKEESIRKILNFGHTIGHAIESLSQKTNKPLLHGEAISIGMVVEGRISNLLGLLSDKDLLQLEESIVHAGLPNKIPDFEIDEILEKMQSDKKSEKGKINWILLKEIGKAIYNQEVNSAIVKKVLVELQKDN